MRKTIEQEKDFNGKKNSDPRFIRMSLSKLSAGELSTINNAIYSSDTRLIGEFVQKIRNERKVSPTIVKGGE